MLAPLIQEFPDLGVIVARDLADEPAPLGGGRGGSHGLAWSFNRPFRLGDIVAASH